MTRTSVFDRIKNRLKFQLELFILRGPVYRLLTVAFLIGFIAVAAGVLVFVVGAAFPSVSEAVWWAFLRLTDPGYLGDDHGVLLRSVSAVVTVLGYVIFLGALVAIMTQWFNQTMNRLQAGLTPIAQQGHILVLGWTNRTATIVHELFYSEGRVQRFLQLFGARRLRVVLLSEEDPGVVAQELHDHLGRLWEPTRFIVRTGSPLRLEHLERVDFLNASAILLPSSDHGSPLETTVDGDVIKTIITVADAAAESELPAPLIVAEIMDSRKLMLARHAYGGPIEIIASGEFLSRLIAQNLRHRGLSLVYSELLGHEWGNEVYLRECPALVGAQFGGLFAAFPTAIPIGVMRQVGGEFKPLLNPPAELVIEAGDRITLIAEDYDAAAPGGNAETVPARTVPPAEDETRASSQRRILVLGWNHKVPTLIRELDGYAGEDSEIHIVSRTPPHDRLELMDRLDVKAERVRLRHIEADFTSTSDLARYEPAGYDTILLLATDSTETDASTDARTLLGYLVLQELLGTDKPAPHILVELLDPDNVGLFRNKPAEVLVSPVLVSHILTQVALRRELRAVFEELFGPDGVEISFTPALELDTRSDAVDFATIQRQCLGQGEIALGVHIAAGEGRGVHLNPDRAERWVLGAGDEIIIVSARPLMPSRPPAT